MTIILELIPIGTLLAVITTQVMRTAVAAHEVLVEKESFRILGKHIRDIAPVLDDLSKRELQDTPAVRTALESLQGDLKHAATLIHTSTVRSRMYLLVHCRSISSEAQMIIQDLAKSLQLISLASADVCVDVSASVRRLKEQMASAQLQASASRLTVIDKLQEGVRERRTDQGFANDLIKDIAKAVGIPVDASAMSRELASFKREKEEAALRKELEEEAFMGQVIALLSRADAAHLLPEFEHRPSYGRVEREDVIVTKEPIPPLKSFICPLKQDVMVDPVSLVTGSCFERSCITEWFEAGNASDPSTHEELSDTSLRSNVPLRESIEEWQERNFYIRILNAKDLLQSGDEGQQCTALERISELCRQNRGNQDLVAREGMLGSVVKFLRRSSPRLKRGSLGALHDIVKGNTANKESLLEAGGVEPVVRCLGRGTSVAKAAAALLLETMDGNNRLGARIGQERSAILLLVTLLNSEDKEAAQLARSALDKLSDLTENVVRMAEANWCAPLVARLHEEAEDFPKAVFVNALASLNLPDDSKKLLAEQGVVAPLVGMLKVGNLELKLAALSALRNLSTHGLIKSQLADAGAIPIVFDYLFSGTSPVPLREAAAAILENVAANDGLKFLESSDNVGENERQTIENLLVALGTSSKSPIIQAHILGIILGVVTPTDVKGVRETTRSLRGIPILLPLLASPERDVRHIAIQILFRLSDLCGKDIAEYLVEKQKLRTVLKLLKSDGHEDVQVAAAGLVAAFPRYGPLTSALVDAEAIPALVSRLQGGSLRVKEAVAGALIKFTDDSDLIMQREVAGHNVHPLLVKLVYSGSTLAKARAATVLGNFSRSTPSLSVEPDLVCGCWGSPRVAKCPVHRGICGVETTFCIVDADAIPGLINLIKDDTGMAAEAGMGALQTLVDADDNLHSGAQFLHCNDGIQPVIDALSEGTAELKNRAVGLLERIFEAKGMKEEYRLKARIPLISLATSGSPEVRKKAAKVLASLSFIGEISTF